jgi:hypothetical protein
VTALAYTNKNNMDLLAGVVMNPGEQNKVYFFFLDPQTGN